MGGDNSGNKFLECSKNKNVLVFIGFISLVF